MKRHFRTGKPWQYHRTKKTLAQYLLFLFFTSYVFIPLSSWLKTETTIVLAAEPVTAMPVSASPTPSPVTEQKQDEGVGREEYKDLIYKIFGEEDGPIAYGIMRCESGGKSNAVKKDQIEWSIGLFQINIRKGNGEGAWVHWDKIPGETGEEKEAWLKVPENNILTAKFIKGSSNWYPWSVYKNGCYKKFL
jgi:hypothetical protein